MKIKKPEYDPELIKKAEDFFEAMKAAKKAIKNYEYHDTPSNGFWRIPECVRDTYERDMEAFGKLLG
jgi:hypothetical protein